MSTHWWRAYDEAVDDPKLILLSSDKVRWGWFRLMCLASAYGGHLPPIEIICVKLRLREAAANMLLDELSGAGLIDEFDGVLRPHNWNGRQFKSDVTDPTAAERMKRYRNKRNASVTVTDPREQRTDTDTEREESCRVADATPTVAPKVLRFKYSDEFETFWRLYPKTPVMSKAEAWKAWGKLSPEDRKAAMAAVPRYSDWLKSKPDHPAVHACRFLSQRRFEGFATGSSAEQTEEQRQYLEKLERMRADAAAGRPASWEN